MPSNRIRIHRERPLTAFASAVHANKGRLRRLWLITPWLATEPGSIDPISNLVDCLRGRQCLVNIVTRTPEQSWHRAALRILWANVRPSLFYCNALHSKLYLAECDGFSCAVVGSPNLTGRADRFNRELALEFRTTMSTGDDEVAKVITDLTAYAQDLTSEDDVELVEEF